MENASKALIIAGAILLAILLISLGIMIFNQAQDTVNNSGMSQAEISAFNNQFLKYEGTQKGSVVKSMINEVIASNSDENHKNNKSTVTVNGKSSTAITTSDISTAATYEIELAYSEEGRVNAITYTKKEPFNAEK
ncbi:MAG: hypothetical protein HFJ37_01825 [Clostridia bacterium]|nr:hypothetical protein [Clostridia bacterium]